MTSTKNIVAKMRNNPRNVRFSDLVKVCDESFGAARIRGDHRVYRTPWAGDPRVNIQDDGSGKAKPYQVRQVLGALNRLAETSDERRSR